MKKKADNTPLIFTSWSYCVSECEATKDIITKEVDMNTLKTITNNVIKQEQFNSLEDAISSFLKDMQFDKEKNVIEFVNANSEEPAIELFFSNENDTKIEWKIGIFSIVTTEISHKFVSKNDLLTSCKTLELPTLVTSVNNPMV